MSKINDAIKEIHHIDDRTLAKDRMKHIHPVSKLLVTIVYMVFVVSHNKYDVGGLMPLVIYPLCMMITLDISPLRGIKRLKVVFFFLLMMGIANVFFDRNVFFVFAGIPITGGAISMVTLWTKALLTVAAVYILMEITSVESICYAMRKLKIPKVFVTVFLLTYRYLVLMLKEADRVLTAYSMRAPGQRGVQMKAWGSLAGNMLLRTMDRGQRVYESMLMRGFNGEFYLREEIDSLIPSLLYTLLWCLIIAVLQFVPVFELVGGLFL